MVLHTQEYYKHLETWRIGDKLQPIDVLTGLEVAGFPFKPDTKRILRIAQTLFTGQPPPRKRKIYRPDEEWTLRYLWEKQRKNFVASLDLTSYGLDQKYGYKATMGLAGYKSLPDDGVAVASWYFPLDTPEVTVDSGVV